MVDWRVVDTWFSEYRGPLLPPPPPPPPPPPSAINERVSVIV